MGCPGHAPEATPFVAAIVCGSLAVIAGVVGWLKTKGRGAVRVWQVVAGLIGVLVLALGARGSYESVRPAAECKEWDVPGPGPALNVLNGVTATSVSNAWAVGRCSAGDPDKTLILHWDGSRWERQRSPNVGWSINVLNGVAATSSSDAWAVGGYAPDSGTYYKTLILRWDGTAWKRQPSPNNAGSELAEVVVTSASDAWAVGWDNRGALILHWDGSARTRQPVPDVGPGIYPYLHGAAAASASDAWAVGSYGGLSGPVLPAIYHWDGSAWAVEPTPQVGTYSSLAAVAATSSSDAWAVGWYEDGAGRHALILHWDGEVWAYQRIPEASSDSSLNGVVATSGINAWAVGTRGLDALILCWDGSVWSEQPSPAVGTDANILNGVTGFSRSEALAVGVGGDGTAARTAIPGCPRS